MEDVKVKVDGSKLMVVIMKATSETMLRTVMESISMLMVINIKGNGRIIFRMEKDKHNIRMEVDTTDNF